MKLHNVTPEDTALKEYVSARMMEHIESVKLVWDKDTPRSGNSWEAIAIKFKKTVKKELLLSLTVGLRSDEYLGKRENHHVFWWD